MDRTTSPSAEPERPASAKRETVRPTLSQDFYASLRPEPGCETDGVCNECGRCEH